MLHIVTPNSAIDMRVVVESFSRGGVFRSRDFQRYSSGKGVNSAFACSAIGKRTSLHLIVGELDVEFFQSHAPPNTVIHQIAAAGETRRNITIVDQDGLVAHLQNSGYSVSRQQVSEFRENLGGNMQSGDTILVSGSLPPGFENFDLFELLDSARERKCTVVLDTDLDRLLAIDRPVADFAKPNIAEFDTFRQASNSADAKDALEKLLLYFSKAVTISLGHKGSLTFQKIGAPVLVCKSEANLSAASTEAVGSGDAFLGAFSCSLDEGRNLREALRFGTAAGHANVCQVGPGRLSKWFPEILDSVFVDEIDFANAITIIEKSLE